MKSLFSALVALGMMLSLPVYAIGQSIAVIDVGQILQDSPQVAVINQRLEDKFEERQKALLAMQKELQALSEEYERDVAVLSEEDRDALEQKIMAKQQKLQNKGQAYQQDLGNEQNKEMGKFFEVVQKAIDSYAEEKELVLVIQDEVVLYAADGLDITDDILKQID